MYASWSVNVQDTVIKASDTHIQELCALQGV